MRARRADVVVVGGGPAGLAAATRLRRIGVEEVVVLDRESHPGGIPRHCNHTSFGLREFGLPMGGPRYAAALLRKAVGESVVVRTKTTALDVGREGIPYVITTSASGMERWDAGAVILATGCRERPRSARLIPGTRAPGTFTTGELQQFTYLHQMKVGHRAVVVGAEHVSFSAVMTLNDAGIECAAIIAPFAGHQSYSALRMLATRFGRIPLLTEHRLSGIEGRNRVEAVLLDTPRGPRTIECDTVIVTGDWVAEGGLALKAGLSEDARNGGQPEVNNDGATINAGIFAAGSILRPGESASRATRSGSQVADVVANHLAHKGTSPSGISLSWASPIRWVSPQRTGAVETLPIRLRVDEWVERPTLVFRTNGKVLDTVTLRRMIPGRTYKLGGSWMRQLEEGAREVQVTIGMDQ